MLSFHKEEKGQNYKQTLYFLSFCALPPPPAGGFVFFWYYFSQKVYFFSNQKHQ